MSIKSFGHAAKGLIGQIMFQPRKFSIALPLTEAEARDTDADIEKTLIIKETYLGSGMWQAKVKTVTDLISPHIPAHTNQEQLFPTNLTTRDMVNGLDRFFHSQEIPDNIRIDYQENMRPQLASLLPEAALKLEVTPA